MDGPKRKRPVTSGPSPNQEHIDDHLAGDLGQDTPAPKHEQVSPPPIADLSNVRLGGSGNDGK